MHSDIARKQWCRRALACNAVGRAAVRFCTCLQSACSSVPQVVILPLQRPELFTRGALTKPTKGACVRVPDVALLLQALLCWLLCRLLCRLRWHTHCDASYLAVRLPDVLCACCSLPPTSRPAAVWPARHRQDDAGQGGGLRERASWPGCCCGCCVYGLGTALLARLL